jgi:hypothetical protein
MYSCIVCQDRAGNPNFIYEMSMQLYMVVRIRLLPGIVNGCLLMDSLEYGRNLDSKAPDDFRGCKL